jgi:Putative Ig domain
MASIVRICFAFILIAPAALTVSGCNDSSSAANTQSSPTDSAATSAALAISGEPPTVAVADAEYSFRPAATGAAGETLTFSVQNAPAWATFDPATGTLSGMPSAADVGTYSHVSIGVSDGMGSAELASFSITVTATGTQPVTLSWAVPTTNTNGTSNTDLAGYHIYYGASAAALNRVIAVDSAGVTSYVFNNLASGTWYFAVAAINQEKIESALSAVGKVTL